MFGHHDDQQTEHENHGNPPAVTVAPASDGGPADTGQPTPVQPDDTSTAAPAPGPGPDDTGTAPPAADPNPPAALPAWQHPGTPLNGDHEQISDVISPAGGYPKRPSYQYPLGAPSGGDDDSDILEGDSDAQQLLGIKQKVLNELSPLIDDLDLPPEDKFRTIMMMIQASDDESLVEKAYQAAHTIEDEKVRAQALLDIVNEINYFTAPHDDGQPPATD